MSKKDKAFEPAGAPDELPKKSGNPDADPDQQQQNASGNDDGPKADQSASQGGSDQSSGPASHPLGLGGQSSADMMPSVAQGAGPSFFPMGFNGLALEFTAEEIREQAKARSAIHRQHVATAKEKREKAQASLKAMDDESQAGGGQALSDTAQRNQHSLTAECLGCDSIIHECERAANTFDLIVSHLPDGIYRLSLSEVHRLEFDQAKA